MMLGRAAFLFLILQGVFVGPGLAEQRCDTGRYPLSSPTERFSDNGDGTVTDAAAQLMWMRCAAGQTWSGGTCVGEAAAYDWQGAQEHAVATSASGGQFFNDWRVPKLRELAMIAERQCENPRINLTIFPETPPIVFWTESLRPGEGFETFAYALSFGPEGVLHTAKSERHAVRLVRTAP
ncbi:Lcl C-terminal domain-containing protein [Thiocapsa marina]|uniref:Lcl C-terminal domain-containing protein n=1 Tax=Thiocapsa marina 5811 TaxID=768671 RepID=F9UFE7_9GAMM|nr:DUF1566 domain-containing protein [Thiocapsa marina]EGV17184.1 protein of unknown function DUF1566 [Thiocapsa marina 5811]